MTPDTVHLSFQGVAGEEGSPGPVGPRGDPGSPGTPGSPGRGKDGDPVSVRGFGDHNDQAGIRKGKKGLRSNSAIKQPGWERAHVRPAWHRVPCGLLAVGQALGTQTWVRACAVEMLTRQLSSPVTIAWASWRRASLICVSWGGLTQEVASMQEVKVGRNYVLDGIAQSGYW